MYKYLCKWDNYYGIEVAFLLCPIIVVTFGICNVHVNVTIFMGQGGVYFTAFVLGVLLHSGYVTCIQMQQLL